MYEYLRGTIASKSPMSVVLDVAGIGFFVEVPLSTSETLPSSGETKLWTSHYVREDAEKLFGFATTRERELFTLLQKVSGVGPGVALAMLSRASVPDLARAIENGDVALLKSLKGVGPKTAQRVITELRDRIGHLAAETSATGSAAKGSLIDDAVQALEVLGCPTKAADKAVRAVLAEETPDALEELVRKALKVAWP